MHEAAISLISMEYDREPRVGTAFPLWLLGSSALHILIFFVLVTVQFSPPDPLPISTLEVALVTLSDPTSARKRDTLSSASSPSSASQKSLSKAARQQSRESMPAPLPVVPQRERLSESFAGAMKSIPVPQPINPVTLPVPDPVSSTATLPPDTSRLASQALPDIELPPEAPNFRPVQPLPNKDLSVPAPPVLSASDMTPSRPTQSQKPSVPATRPSPEPQVRETVRELLTRVPSVPKAPSLASAQPLPLESSDLPDHQTPAAVSSSIEDLVASIPLPKQRPRNMIKPKQAVKAKPPQRTPSVPMPQAPTLAPATPSEKPRPFAKTVPVPQAPRRRPLAESLQEVLGTVTIPEIREQPPSISLPEFTDKDSPALEKARRTTREAIAQLPSSDPTWPRTSEVTEQSRNKAQEALARIKIPDVPVSRKPSIPSSSPQAPDTAKANRRIQQALAKIKIPEELPVTKTKSTQPVIQPMHPDTLRNEIDNQLDNLKVPEVRPIDSLRSRLQVRAITDAEPESTQAQGLGTRSSQVASSIHRQYLARVRELIDRQWIAPTLSIDNKHLETIVAFRILRNGTITQLHVEKGSGHPYYDAAAQRAVQAADPLPPLPEILDQSSLDVHFRFTLGK
ncbi:MAG: TonB family protein [Nitrospirae bacterium]|nr:MAG: TonB family protein [Nitrospirota bacterium]